MLLNLHGVGSVKVCARPSPEHLARLELFGAAIWAPIDDLGG
jgi:hypothetical protein